MTERDPPNHFFASWIGTSHATVSDLKKRPRDEHMPPARSATCGAKSPAISVAADQ